MTKNRETSNDDVLVGTSESDKLRRRTGGDLLTGSDGNDDLRGTKGDDTLLGRAGDDRLNGGAGNDVLDGGAGNDRVDGSAGNDVAIYVAAENTGAHDVYKGGSGRDTLRLVVTEVEMLRGAVQADIAVYQAFLTASARRGERDDDDGDGEDEDEDRGAGVFRFTAFDLSAKSFEALEVQVLNSSPVAKDDSFATDEDTALGGNLLADNGAGADSDPGGDALRVTAINGVAIGSGATVILDSGARLTVFENGTFSYDPSNAAALQALHAGESLTDSFSYTIGDGDGGFATARVNVSVAGRDDIVVGTEGDDSFAGTAGADHFFGLGGNDVAAGGGGDDILDGGAGNDALDGGAGNDTLIGGDGNDWLTGGDGDDVVDAGAGDDTVVAGSGAGNDNYQGGPGNDTLVYSSTTLGVTVDLGAGTASGTEVGSDSLEGFENVIGGSGNDVLRGDAGDNRIEGGRGNDLLIGGGGIDTLVFGPDNGDDIVMDGSNSNLRIFQDTAIASVRHLDSDADGRVDTRYTFTQGGSATFLDFLDNTAPVAPPLESAYLEDSVFTIGIADLLARVSDRETDPISLVDLRLLPDADGRVNATLSFQDVVPQLGDTGTHEVRALIAPAENFNGVIELQATFSDGYATTTSQVVLTGIPVNDAPQFFAGGVRIVSGETRVVGGFEDLSVRPFEGIVLGDVEGDEVDISVSVREAAGTIRYLLDGNYTTEVPQLVLRGGVTDLSSLLSGIEFNAAENQSGLFHIEVTATDPGGASTSLVSEVNLASVNDAPREDPTVTFTGRGVEDTPRPISAAELGLIDDDGDALRIEDASVLPDLTGRSHAMVAQTSSGDWQITPEINFFGGVRIRFTVSDGNGGTIEVTRDIDFTPVNDAPREDHTATITMGGVEDTPRPISAAELGLIDDDGDALRIENASVLPDLTGRSRAVALQTSSGDWQITPEMNYFGVVRVLCTASDGNGGTIEVTRDIDFTPVNDAPRYEGSAPIALTTLEDQPLVFRAADFDGSWSDPDVDAGSFFDITYEVTLDNPALGTIIESSGGNEWTFTPAPDFTGTAVIDYTANDGDGGSTPSSLIVNVTAANDPPIARDDAYLAIEDTPILIPFSNVLTNDSDPDGDPLAVIGASGNANTHGIVFYDPANGVIHYTPDANYNGPANFDYTIGDGNGATAAAKVSLTVQPVNDLPDARDDAFHALQSTRLDIPFADLLRNDFDVDLDPLGVVSATANANTHGTAVFDPTAQMVHYNPDPGYVGPANFSYTISDGRGGFDTAMVQITVDPVPPGPGPGPGPGPALPPLFTNFADTVDFVSVVAGTYAPGTQYNALDSNDNVILPVDPGAAAIAGFVLGTAFNGGNGDDSLTGGNANDFISGDAGNDAIKGGAGNDNLNGGPGADVLSGGPGADMLIGGANSDRFDYDVLDASTDTIVDFIRGVGGDVLDIKDLLIAFNPASPASYVQFLNSGPNTLVNVNADGIGTDFVTLTSLTGMTGVLLNDMLAQGNLVLQ